MPLYQWVVNLSLELHPLIKTENTEIKIISQQRALFALAAIIYKHVTILLWNMIGSGFSTEI
jgi:hypothetical protein